MRSWSPRSYGILQLKDLLERFLLNVRGSDKNSLCVLRSTVALVGGQRRQRSV